jgi:hypothetical protein
MIVLDTNVISELRKKPHNQSLRFRSPFYRRLYQLAGRGAFREKFIELIDLAKDRVLSNTWRDVESEVCFETSSK